MNGNGKIYVIGLGPGNRQHTTPAAIEAIGQSGVIVGYNTYIELIEDLLTDKKVVFSGMRKEVDRCTQAFNYASQGEIVSLISSGDAGVYGMAGIMNEVLMKKGSNIEIEIVPGITAANAAASILGAPIMHDYVTISLSDLLTDWKLIKKRLHCGGEGDFVICIYNPKSKGRQDHIKEARDILLKYKRKDTPVGIVRNAKREKEGYILTTLEHMLDYEIDMVTVVIVGNSHTYIANNRMITPRGYRL
ncbi:precorrin-3B C(17)-methyltransferase [Alkaliphilus pronyensis]|uniref:Precorrin-3B C(17)-methyltransferase n=1 Tax=Alkaliphilus pronyensis TaxID=1482732 RepID=A0A6I0FKW9_9FIRM|nr:precorrin-3B C(17)-methyltransferase [Alkaliphilus pronyensis]KAB3539058.1 precorrin-3B C(17)-methyltransferase [Alkaliphilus pronyensis]